MTSTKRPVALLLAVLTVLSVILSSVLLLPVAAEDNIASDQPVTIPAYDGSCSPRQVTSDYCIRIHFGAPFNALSVVMPTWTTTDSEASLALYKWTVDYNTTIKTEPIAYQMFAPLKDNAENRLTFEEQPAGEYLFRIADIKGTVGVFGKDMTVSNGYCYTTGQESRADWWMNVSFTKTPVEPFLPVSSIMDGIDGNHKPPAEYVPAEDSLLNTHKVMPDTWVFTDGLGRESLTYEEVGGPKDNKTIAMFYWTWHDNRGGGTGFNTTEFMKEHPDAKNDYDHPAWPENTAEPCNVSYFWNEPIYGYYRTTDAWVLRRQSELLANAGVDTIFTDNTNGAFTWKESYDVLYPTWDNAQREGAVNTPKISFTLPFYPFAESAQQITSLYLDIYRTGKYQNLWFYHNDKPMLMGCNDNFYNSSSKVGKEIYNFFSWRSTLIGGNETSDEYKKMGQWGWLATYPQPVFYGDRDHVLDKRPEQMTVGVATNYNYKTQSGTAMNGEFVTGRSYSSDYPDRYEKEGTEASKYGYFFSEQFDYVLDKDPDVVFITGWNEWTAGRHQNWGGIENAFPDQFIDEFSRDIEPTKGELKDHYYYLLVNYVRRFKGVNPIPTPSFGKTIDMTAGADQWADVAPYYAAYIGNTDDREAEGYGTLTYTEYSGRNDIIGARIARNEDTVWFYVECNDTITPYTDNLWMNLYIDIDQENQGWETFEYVVNKSAASADTLVLEKFTGDGYASEKVTDVKYHADGTYMVVEIPKTALGLAADEQEYTINFSWTDNVHDEGNYDAFTGDIMDFYISGDVAPGARFKYSYISTPANAGYGASTEPAETLPSTPAESDTALPDTQAPADTAATRPEDTTPGTVADDSAKDGCGSAFAAQLMLAAGLPLAAAFVLKRRDDN